MTRKRKKPRDLSDRAAFSDGGSIPRLGLGVYLSPSGKATVETVQAALRLGYRHIDTAAAYGNEAEVGQGLRASGVDRNDVFVTTKLWNDDQGYDRALRAFDRSTKLLKLDYLDLYLIHWPVPGLRLESWRALVRLREEGRVRSIGVSNFLVPHLEELIARFPVKPVINQVELHPFLTQDALFPFCERHGILIEAYSPLTKGVKLGDPAVNSVAAKHGKSPAQILIRWSLETADVSIPKTNRAERLRENIEVFDFSLDAEDHARLGALNENLYTGWDPRDVD